MSSSVQELSQQAEPYIITYHEHLVISHSDVMHVTKTLLTYHENLVISYSDFMQITQIIITYHEHLVKTH